MVVFKLNKNDEMKKCPRCMQTDYATQRYCVHCGTELFFERRFIINDPKKNKNIWHRKLINFFMKK